MSYLALITERGTTIEKAPIPGLADADVHATTAEWKACIIAGVQVTELPGMRFSGSGEAIADSADRSISSGIRGSSDLSRN